ncbi:MAG: aminopeptidase [Phycisphaerae bacterium]
MYDPRLDKLADVIVNYSVAVKRGEDVYITSEAIGTPLVTAIYAAVVKAGGHPFVSIKPDEWDEILLTLASDEQLLRANTFEKYIMATVPVRIALWAEHNTRSLSNVDTKKQAALSKGRKPILDIFMKREALVGNDPKRLRWVGTLFPTAASAQDAEMSLREYEDFVYRAGKLHLPNPVAAWKKQGVAQQRLADYMNKAREVHFKTPQGTDVRMGIAGRKWINCQGESNFPDGEIFSAPIEDAVDGTVYYQIPAVYGGREVTDIRLTFKAGRVIDCSASKNEDYLIKMLDQDKGGRTLGEIALGTNYDIKIATRNTLFDEKIGGTFHAALGAAYPATGGKNSSGLHWDMVCDLRKGGTVTVDGKVISKNGKFAKAEWPR